jgi:hypothetical protein
MQYRMMIAAFLVIAASVLVRPGGLPALAGSSSLSPALASTATPSPTPRVTSSSRGRVQGTVLGQRVNVRRSPSTASAIVGVVRRGDRVQIAGRQSGWLQILYPAGPGGLGWISAPLVAVDGETPSRTSTRPGGTPTPSAAAVPAPKLVAYDEPTFAWAWNGINQVAGTDWYFDIQLFKSSGQDPYFVLAAEPSAATLAGGIWTFSQRLTPDCGSYWVVQIAKRVNGAFAGWISPKSNRLPIGEACSIGNTGDDDSTPEPEPTDTPCPDC